MTEDIEEAVAPTPTNGSYHANDPRRRSGLHDEITALSAKESDTSTASRLGLVPELSLANRGLPITMPNAQHKKSGALEDAKLLHPVLHNIPMQFRFGCNGILSNVLFMVAYNYAVEYLEEIPASRIYLVLYFFFIPIGHAMASIFVFGWPERYFPSLLSNFPIGLTAMAIGGALTAYLDRVDFNEIIEEWIRDNLTFSHMPPRNADEKSEFYSSIIVLIVTSVWTYVLSVYINTPKAISEKKEL